MDARLFVYGKDHWKYFSCQRPDPDDEPLAHLDEEITLAVIVPAINLGILGRLNMLATRRERPKILRATRRGRARSF